MNFSHEQYYTNFYIPAKNIYLSISICISLSIRLYIFISICISKSLFYSSIYSYIYLSFYLSIYIYTTFPSLWLSIQPCIYPSINPAVYLSISISINLSTSCIQTCIYDLFSIRPFRQPLKKDVQSPKALICLTSHLMILINVYCPFLIGFEMIEFDFKNHSDQINIAETLQLHDQCGSRLHNFYLHNY